MPEGSLQTQIATLQQALSGIGSLLGDGNVGLSGAASVSASGGGVQVSVEVEVHGSGLAGFDASALVNNLLAVSDQLKGLDLTKIEGLGRFTANLQQLDGLFNSDLVQKITALVEAVRSISSGIPQNRAGVLEALVEQVLEVMRSLGGPEAEQIGAWMESLAAQLRQFLPLIEEARNAPDPAAILTRVVGEAVSALIKVFNFPQIQASFAFLDQAPGNLLSANLLLELGLAFDANLQRYNGLISASGGTVEAYTLEVTAYMEERERLNAALRPVLGQLMRITRIELLQQGMLERRLRALMDRVLDVRIHENQQIQDPYQALLARIDAAVDQIDLSFVRDQVRGFFERTRQTIEAVDIPSLGEQLTGPLNSVDNAVSGLENGVSDLLGDLQAHLEQLLAKLREMLGHLGSFQPDNSFTYHFERDLNRLFLEARHAVAGDPEHPEAASLAGSLSQMQTSIDQFLSQLTGLLQPVVDATDGLVDDAVQGIESFTAFLAGLNIPELMAALAAKLDEILEALAPIDFDPVVDPIVAELAKNRDALAKIKTDDLNDMLKFALSEAIKAIISIDFSVTISAPLVAQFDQVKQLPNEAIQYLQERYDDALKELDKLSPSQLLSALLAAFDVIKAAVNKLNVASLLAPLDALHDRHLRQPVLKLKPSTLLTPVSEAFQGALGQMDGISGQAIMAPLVSELDGVKNAVAGLNLTAPLDELLALVAKVKSDLAEIRPSQLLEGLAAAFDQLETELDRFKPSVVFAPVAELAQPLLGFLEEVQQDTVTQLFQIFEAPLRLLERLNPEALVREIQAALEAVLALLRTVNPASRFNQLKARHFDLKAAASVGGVSAKLELTAMIDPQLSFGEIMAVHNQLVTQIETLKNNLALPDLAGLYGEMRERLLGLLPPYARALLDVETFRRVMRLADPTRFLTELDARFETIKGKLLVIDPRVIGAELDTTYETVLALLDNVDISAPIQRVKATIDRLKGVVAGIRVDFVAADLDRVVADFRAVLNGLDPAHLLAGMDAVHGDLLAVIDGTKPSQVLAGLQAPLDQVKQILDNLDPETRLKIPIEAAWQAVLDALAEVEFAVLLKPLVDRLDELELSFVAGLRKVETAFDQMLAAGNTALGSGGGVSLSASVSIGGF